MSFVINTSSLSAKGSEINWSLALVAVAMDALPAITSRFFAFMLVPLPTEDSVVPFISCTTVLPENASPFCVELPVIAVLIYDCWLAELSFTSPVESIITFSPI